MKRLGTIIFVLTLLASGCTGSRLKTMQKTETIMGTEVTITVVARNERSGSDAIDAAMAEVRRFDEMMSLYKDTSEITRVNLAAGKRPVKVSPEMIDVVEAAARISDHTDGAFDVTIGPLVVLWQMRLKENRIPTDAEIAAVSRRVGYKKIVIDKKTSTLFLRNAGMIMDLGGVAKGYAADKAADALKRRGIENGIVALAGDIRVIGRRPDNSPWRIGVQHPREHDKTLTVLELSDKAVSTSGDYERFQIVNKKSYHHIINPHTGRPSEGMESATIIGDRGEVVDPLTTASFIIGAKRALKIVKDLGCEAIFVDDKGRILMTEGIKIMQARPDH